MDICNNRYRIIKTLDSKIKGVKRFIAEDLWNKEQEHFELKIIEMDVIGSDFKSFLRNNFFILKNQNKNIYIQNYTFTRVTSIDGININDNLCLYTTEYVENGVSLLEFLQEARIEQILELAVAICQVLNFIITYKITYTSINFSNVLIIKNNQNYKIKILDIITAKLKDPLHLVEIDTSNVKKFQYDYYILKNCFLSLLEKKQLPYTNLRTISEIKNKYSKLNISEDESKIINCILNICMKLETNRLNKNQYNLSEIINEINQKLNKDFSLLNTNKCKNIITSKIISRNKEKKEIFSHFNNIQKGIDTKNLFLITSKLGLGKTSFLEELNFLFLLEKCSVYNIPSLGEFEDEEFILYIMRNFILNTNLNNTAYEKEILDTIEFITKKKNDPNLINKIAIQKHKLVNLISNLLLDKVSSEFAVFIIDDIHKASNLIINIFLFLALESVQKKSLILIFSYDESETQENEHILNFFKIINGLKNISKIKLENLSEDDSYSLISCMLGSKNIPEIFIKKIYNHTNGNPLFISEIIKELISTKEIKKIATNSEYQFSETLLKPNSGIKRYKNIENTIKKHLKKIDPKNIKILNAMSVFQNTFTIEAILKILNIKIKNKTKLLEYFLDQNIIKKTSNKKNNEYSIENKILQKTVYEELPKNYKMMAHKKIMNLITTTSRFSVKEMIWHAERGHQEEKAIKYCIDNKEYIKNIYIPTEYIFIFEKILSFINEKNISDKLKVILILAKTHSDLNHKKECTELLNMSEKIINNNDIDEKLIISLNNVRILHEIQTGVDLKTIKGRIDAVEELLKRNDNLEEKLIFFTGKIKFLQNNEKYEEALNLSNKMIDIASKNKALEEKKAIGLLNLGNCFYYMKKFEKAETQYIKAIKIAEKIKDVRTKDASNNNLAIIFSNLRYDFKSSLKCYHNIINNNDGFSSLSVQILALINSATTNFFIGKYNEVYNNCVNAINKLSNETFENRILFANTTMFSIVIKLRKLEEALSYQEKIKILLSDKTIIQKPMYNSVYFQNAGYINMLFGNYKKASYFISKSIEIENITVSLRPVFLKILLETNTILMNEKTNPKKLISYYENIKNNQDLYKQFHIHFFNMLELTRKLLIKFPIINITKILKLLISFNITGINYNLKAEKLFLKSFLYKKNKEKYLIEANNVLKKPFDIDLYIDINIQLAIYYMNNNNINMAIVKFFQVQKSIKKILNNTPEKYQQSFFNTNKYGIPFIIIEDFLNNKLKEYNFYINKNYTKNRIKKFLNNENILKIKKNENFINDLINQNIKKLKITNINYTHTIKNFSDNFLENIESLLYFLSINLLANSYNIFLRNINGSITPIFNFEQNTTMKELKKILKYNTNPPPNFNDNKNLEEHLIVPIYHYDDIQNKHKIKGYFVFSSENEINNFGELGIKLCKDLENIFAFLIDSYQAQKEASIDKLTDVLTRKYIETEFSDGLLNAKKNNQDFAVLMYDLDNFKKINDTFGHQVGDIVLVKTAAIAKKNLPKGAAIGRFGGEEFLVLLPKINIGQAKIYAENIRKEIENLNFNNNSLKVTISIGVSIFPKNGNTKHELFLRADQALYHSKNNGRNQVSIWEDNITVNKHKEDSFTGILLGKSIEDKKKMSILLELISLNKKNITKNKKLTIALNTIVDLINSDNGIIIHLNDKKTLEENINSLKKTHIKFNSNLIQNVIRTKKGLYQIDWENISEINQLTKIPSWNSIIIAPIIKGKKVKALIYLTVAIIKKEFSIEEFNTVNIFIKSIAPYF